MNFELKEKCIGDIPLDLLYIVCGKGNREEKEIWSAIKGKEAKNEVKGSLALAVAITLTGRVKAQRK